MQNKFIWPISIIYLKKTKSTNKFAKKYLNKILLKFKNWIIIQSKHQTDGKGYSGSWCTENGKNLTFSLIFKPKKINIYNLYIINIIISNAIHKSLSKILNYPIWIKWPNDIIIDNKKIGGILIENNFIFDEIYISIIGIGINIKQKKFNIYWNASSLSNIFNIEFDLDYIINNIIFHIQNEYLLFINNVINIKRYYIKHLYLKNKISNFFFLKKKIFFYGIIKSINNKGHVLIEVNGKLKYFYQKEIKLL
ncbi:biotin--[acetyl-CoA-carboxylase] ligase [Blattabacterium cuenoti]|uniref:biotin--[acetyl-CoA-carboxylase] ligase n=1 Tax=Blattabacterium cuenoti TaxID=1653831 RepID=UPI00163C708F|nr:biotin--[acetyl-CoA-carboxylase] ligase [Blattabacterium cuenoti]